MNKIAIFILIGVISFSCGKKGNRFEDETLRKIYTLQDERNTKELVPYLSNEKDTYREAAAIAFASVQDTNAVINLLPLLKDKNEEIRFAAAYAIGQTKYAGSEPDLEKAYQSESSPSVKSALLIAIGKSASTASLAYLNGLNFSVEDSVMAEGQAWAYFFLANKKMTSDTGTKKMVEMLDTKMSDRARIAASAYLARARGIDLTIYYKQIVNATSAEKNVYVRMNLARAFGKIKENSIFLAIDLMLQHEKDYRVKVNVVSAMRNFDYLISRMRLFKAVSDSNPHVAQCAAEVLLDKGDMGDSEKYLEKALQAKHWRVRALLFSASLKYAAGPNKIAIDEKIMKAYQQAENAYEKGNLLLALGQDISNHKFIADQTFMREGLLLGTYGMEALSAIRQNPNFGKATGSDSLFEEFNTYFKRAIQSGQVSMIAVAAGLMRDTSINGLSGAKNLLRFPHNGLPGRWNTFKMWYSDYSFLTVAQSALKMPRDIEIYIELQKTIDFYNKKETKDLPKATFNHPIDWALVKTIAPDQKVVLKTSKGNITLELLVNESPGSVSNFVQLIKSGFFVDGVFHRVVPNFVVQGGCPRGDGWGNSEYTIRSELGPLNFNEGYLGMASAGKDTEGCQWFITHSPTPHLDGIYSIFGKVTEGMDVVQRLEMSDRILGFDFLK